MSTIPSQTHISVDVGGSHAENQQEVDHESSFSISQERLAELVQINDAVSLEQNGRIDEIAAALKSNVDSGIAGDKRDIGCRQRAFGFNCQLEDHHNPTMKSFNELVLEAFKDSTIILLLCCAMLSLLIGIKTNGPQEGLLDGVIMLLAIVVVVNFSIMSSFFKTRLMLRKLKKHKRVVSVIRCGKMQQIPDSELVVGDVVFLEAGNQVPSDGLFIHGDSFKLDDGQVERGIKYTSMFGGAKVVEGNGRMLVTAVGKNTERGKLIRRVLRNRDKEPKLQAAIDKMNCRLENLWLILYLLILSVQALRCFMQKSSTDECHNPDPKGLKNTVEDIMNESTRVMKKQGGKVSGLVSVLCTLLLATRDGLPLGILVLCFCSSRKMRTFGATVQNLSACVTIGLVKSICLGKTNGLTLQHSEMAELWIGLNRVVDVPDEVNNQLLKEAIGVTSSGQVIKDSLLFCTKQVLPLDMDEEYRNSTILYNEPSSDKKYCMPNLTRGEEENQVQILHWKGTPDFILPLFSHYYDVDGTMQILDEEKRQLFTRLIDQDNGSNSPQCFAFACKKIIHEEDDNFRGGDQETLHCGFALLGLARLKIPYAPEVIEALAECRALGINVKLVVDDDVNMARIMALNCGIEEAVIVEASHFRNSSAEARTNMIAKIHVVAKASPTDRLLVLECLRKKDEVVAITSSFKRDFPSLLEADVGIFMDNHNTEVVEEDADIIVGQNIGEILSILKTGRYVCKQIETFLQLHLILNLSAFALNFIFEVWRSEARLTWFHLLWTNLIMETLGAFALSMWVDPRMLSTTIPPIGSNGPVITKFMWRNIATQSLFQVAILLALAMKGKDIFHVDENVLSTMIFNCYVLCQVFTLIGTIQRTSSTCHGRKFHVNYLFFVIMAVTVALQVILVEIMRFTSHWGKLDNKKWFICIGISVVSIPVGYAAEWVSVMILQCSCVDSSFLLKHVNFCSL